MLEDFELHDTKGSDRSRINTREMQQAAQKRSPLTVSDLRAMSSQHELFLATGGSGGRWKIFTTGGVVWGVYQLETVNGQPLGKQAAFDMQHLSKDLALQEAQLPYSSWVGCYGRQLDWSDANLTGALFCDANLERSLFPDAQLQGADFSRANLRYVSFMNANLEGADFENADLAGADFRGALLKGARFPSANLHNIKR
jgi:uncharacterized protein YjbI with pentapeptide repeats